MNYATASQNWQNYIVSLAPFLYTQNCLSYSLQTDSCSVGKIGMLLRDALCFSSVCQAGGAASSHKKQSAGKGLSSENVITRNTVIMY